MLTPPSSCSAIVVGLLALLVLSLPARRVGLTEAWDAGARRSFAS
jgi:hypothetical protein